MTGSYDICFAFENKNMIEGAIIMLFVQTCSQAAQIGGLIPEDNKKERQFGCEHEMRLPQMRFALEPEAASLYGTRNFLFLSFCTFSSAWLAAASFCPNLSCTFHDDILKQKK